MNPFKDVRPERLQFARSRWRPPVEGVGEHCVISKDAVIGRGAQIGNHVVIHERVSIGEDCIIKDHAVIGAPGFGYASDHDGIPIRIHHDGGVLIGNKVEVGSFTTVCSGTVNPTKLDDYVKLDDHVHIAHNANLKRAVMIVAGAVIGGGTIVDEDCCVGINAVVINKIHLGRRCFIGAGAVVIGDVPAKAVIVGNPGRLLRYE